MTFEVGDEVIIDAPSTPLAHQYKGERGTIESIVAGQRYPYEVKFHYRTKTLGFAASELTLAGLGPYLEVVDEMVEAIAPTKDDEIDHPGHYTWLPNGVEVIDITELLPFNLGNVVKYVLRAGHKHDEPLTDLRKAAWYINREIERLEDKA
ncbi:DUF3310 domain-containing protein [Streptomyces sp. NPDC056944]|uniref:DUF3310 domain-containing protein n=1 Tax=Streptomyces sp. NPDC056944 TaxID=3345972 RepID=UPI00363DD637